MFHRTPRLFLRPSFAEDWRAIRTAMGDGQSPCFVPRVAVPGGEDEARRLACLAQDERVPHFLVTLPGTGVIGVAGLCADEAEPAIGCWIAQHYRGRGYATEAVYAVMEIARMLGHVRLKAYRFSEDPAWERVLAKLGFGPAGKVRAGDSSQGSDKAPAIEYRCELSLSATTCGARAA